MGNYGNLIRDSAGKIDRNWAKTGGPMMGKTKTCLQRTAWDKDDHKDDHTCAAYQYSMICLSKRPQEL